MGGTILLADDSLTIQKVVELTFSDTDFTVTTVSTGDELLQRLPNVKPDVIICDVIMPGRDGYDVCQQVKSNPATLQIPVVLLTGTFEPFDRDRALAAGCSEIISKPFEARKLVETVERLVHQAQAAHPPDLPPPQVEGAVRPPFVPPAAPAATPPAPPTWPAPPPQAAAPSQAWAPSPVEELGDEGLEAQGEFQPDGDEALDFTASGFAEMEAAGREAAVERMEAPSEGLDFERHPLPEGTPETEEAALRESPWADRSWDEEEPAVAEAEERPWVERPSDLPEPVAEEPADEAAVEPFGEPEAIILEPWQETAPEASTEVAESADLEPVPEPLAGDVTPAEPFPADTGHEEAAPFHTMPMARLDDLVEAAREMEEPAAEVFDEAPFESEGELAETEELATGLEEPAEPILDEEPVSETRADTQPSVVVPTPAAHSALSDEDVDRVARRVLELARGLIEQIAWDVVPDMAEIVVRERVREIEDEVERGRGEA
jgi:CheY-like chemotaxis protein